MSSSQRPGAPPHVKIPPFRFPQHHKEQMLKEFATHGGYPPRAVVQRLAALTPGATFDRVHKWFMNERQKRKGTANAVNAANAADNEDEEHDDEMDVDQPETQLNFIHFTPKRPLMRISKKAASTLTPDRTALPRNDVFESSYASSLPILRASVAYNTYLGTETEEEKRRFGHPMQFVDLHQDDQRAWIVAYPGVLTNGNDVPDPSLQMVWDWPTPFKCLVPNCGKARSTSNGLREHIELMHEDCPLHSTQESIACVEKDTFNAEEQSLLSASGTSQVAVAQPTSSKNLRAKSVFGTPQLPITQLTSSKKPQAKLPKLSRIIEFKVPRLSEVVRYSHSTGQPANSIVVDIPKAAGERAVTRRINFLTPQPRGAQGRSSTKRVAVEPVQDILADIAQLKPKVAPKPRVRFSLENVVGEEEVQTKEPAKSSGGRNNNFVLDAEIQDKGDTTSKTRKKAGWTLKAARVRVSEVIDATDQEPLNDTVHRARLGEVAITVTQQTQIAEDEEDEEVEPRQINWEKREEMLKKTRLRFAHSLYQYPESNVRAEPRPPFNPADFM